MKDILRFSQSTLSKYQFHKKFVIATYYQLNLAEKHFYHETHFNLFGQIEIA